MYVRVSRTYCQHLTYISIASTCRALHSSPTGLLIRGKDCVSPTWTRQAKKKRTATYSTENVTVTRRVAKVRVTLQKMPNLTVNRSTSYLTKSIESTGKAIFPKTVNNPEGSVHHHRLDSLCLRHPYLSFPLFVAPTTISTLPFCYRISVVTIQNMTRSTFFESSTFAPRNSAVTVY